MSDIFYPLAAIERLEIERVNRVLVDGFEDGTQSASRRWGLRNFKRRFHIQHAPLRSWEAEALLGFHADRNGPYDTFWFRDNIFKTGSASVRFPDGFKLTRERLMTGAEVILEETTPSAAIPTAQQLFTASGDQAPLIWWDANRVQYFKHPTGSFTAPTTTNDTTIPDQMGNYNATWQQSSGLLLPKLYSANDRWELTGLEWAKTSSNITLAGGTTPALTMMLFRYFDRQGGVYDNEVLFFTGAKSATNGLGIYMTNGRNMRITDGSTRYGTFAATDPGWQSIALSTAASSNDVAFYNNGTLSSTETIARNHTAGPCVLGAYPDGTNIANPGVTPGVTAGFILDYVSTALLFNSALTAAQIKAIHNLYAPVLGLAQV